MEQDTLGCTDLRQVRRDLLVITFDTDSIFEKQMNSACPAKPCCWGLNFVSQNQICWSPDPRALLNVPHLETKPLQGKPSYTGLPADPNPIGPCPERGDLDTQGEGEDGEWQGCVCELNAPRLLAAWEVGGGRRPCPLGFWRAAGASRHLEFGFLAPEPWDKAFCCSKPPICGVLFPIA